MCECESGMSMNVCICVVSQLLMSFLYSLLLSHKFSFRVESFRMLCFFAIRSLQLFTNYHGEMSIFDVAVAFCFRFFFFSVCVSFSHLVRLFFPSFPLSLSLLIAEHHLKMSCFFLKIFPSYRYNFILSLLLFLHC